MSSSTGTRLFDILVSQDGQSLWPHSKLEAWKYFDIKKLNAFKESKTINQESTVLVSKDIQNTIVVKDNQYVISKNLLDLGVQYSLESGVQILNPETQIDHRFLKINQRSVKLKLTFKNLNLQQKIEIKHQNTTDKHLGSCSLYFELIDSDLALLQDLNGFSLSPKSFNSILVQALLKKSRLRHFVVEGELSVDKGVIYTTEARLEGKSNYKIFLSTLNSQFVRNQNSVHVLDQQAKAEILSFTLASQKAYVENRTEISLFDEFSESRQLVKTILSDEAQMVFNGRIYVSPKALKTESSQTYKGLLLSKKAQMNAKPELEIYADDVKAAHGAAIGQVSDEEIFYLLSRGIAPERAYELLAQAFAGEVINEIKDLELRKEIETQIRKASEPIFQDLLQTYKKAAK